MAKRVKKMQVSADRALSRGVGRPKLSDDGSEQVTLRYPKWMLAVAAEIIDERGGPGVIDRATVLRELTAKGIEAYRRGK